MPGFVLQAAPIPAEFVPPQLGRDFAALRQELFEALKRLKALAVATP